MIFNNLTLSAFRRFYKLLSPKNKTRVIYLLDNLNLLPSSLKKKINYKGTFKVKVSPGINFKMVGYGGDIEKATFRSGLFVTWERDVGWIWKDLCKMSQLIFDVGANTGIYSLTAKAINKNCQVYAFEPSLRNFKKLRENFRINNFRIISEQLAISNITGRSAFYDTHNEHETTASLSAEKLKNATGYKGEVVEYKVEVITLSDYIEQNSIKQLDLMKLDIELHELEALKGLGQYLLLYKPIILIEVLRTEMAKNLNSFFNLKDYKLFHLKASQKAELVTEFKQSPTVRGSNEWNYLIFHNSLEEKIKRETSLYKNLIVKDKAAE